MTSTFGAPWPRPGRYRRGPTAWPTDRESRIRWLEEHQRDLEQRAADVADRIRHLRERPSGPDRAEAHRSEPRPRPRRSRATADGRSAGRAGRGWPTWGPAMARAREVELGEGRRLTVRELAGPPDAPTLLLLHGWGGTAAGNWATALPALARHFHVVAPDLPGHDRETVEDLAALIDRLDLGGVIAVGYSLGSAVAYQLWRQHPEQVDGLVLCAPAGVSALVPAAAPAPGSARRFPSPSWSPSRTD